MVVAEYTLGGGTGTYTRNLLDLLVRHGADVTLVSGNATQVDDFERLSDGPEVSFVAMQANAKPVGMSSRGFLRPLRGTDAALYKRYVLGEIAQLRDIDTVITSVGTPGALLWATDTRRRSIYLLHTYPHGFRVKLRPTCLRSSPLPPSTQLVTVSDSARRETCRAWNIPRSHCEVILSSAGQVLEQKPSPRSPQTILTVGHVERHKNPRMWIRVAAEVLRRPGFEDTRFVWLGEGSQLAECRSRVRDLGLSGRVMFEGFKENVDVYYGEASIYAQLSSVESLGLGVLDAARRGIPQVVTAVGGLTEVVANGVSGLVVRQRDWMAAADAVVWLLRNTEERLAMGQRSATRYASIFSPETWEHNWLAMLSASE